MYKELIPVHFKCAGTFHFFLVDDEKSEDEIFDHLADEVERFSDAQLERAKSSFHTSEYQFELCDLDEINVSLSIDSYYLETIGTLEGTAEVYVESLYPIHADAWEALAIETAEAELDDLFDATFFTLEDKIVKTVNTSKVYTDAPDYVSNQRGYNDDVYHKPSV